MACSDLSKVLDAIERPLNYASKNGFAHLANIAGLDELIPSLVQRACHCTDDPALRAVLFDIGLSFANFSELPCEARKNVITNALSALMELKQPSACRTTAPTAAGTEDAVLQALSAPVSTIKGIGPKLAAALARLGVSTVEDLLYLLPRTYLDKRRILKIAHLHPGEYATIIGTIRSITGTSFAAGKKLFRIRIADETGALTATWFYINAAYLNLLRKKFAQGHTVIVSGLVSRFQFAYEMHHPEIDLFSDENHGNRLAIEPVYPLTEGMQQKTMQRIIRAAIVHVLPQLIDYLPVAVRQAYALADLNEAFHRVHIPDNTADVIQLVQCSSLYHRRIVFDEFFFLQLALAIRRANIAVTPGITFNVDTDRLILLLQRLPFTLTVAQRKCLDEILADMSSPWPMHRLIQGDVGCGKTVVALLASHVAIWNGYQAVLMAPTEILAEQHFRTVRELTKGSGITPVLLTSGQPKSQRDEALALIQQGNAHLIIGTHALIQGTVTFHRLGLTVIDEQHKFGVLQRAKLLRKGEYPDLLVMTATPIPRTLGLTVYGDLDISVINELPPGRPPVRTLVFHEGQRTMVYTLVDQELQKGNQAFIVYPLIEESENIELMNATRMASHLQQDVFVQYKVGLLHGRMTSVEKEAIMQSFQAGLIHILVATTVIEVGIDIPSASVMVIEHAERFGLSQLHQLRGRIGRGSSASLCVLLAQYRKSDDAEQRLMVMARTNNGFEIAEEDFRIRGPGEFLGTRQSGIPDFRVAHIGRDASILAEAREAAVSLITSDPQLLKPEHRYLRKMLLYRWKERLELAGIG